ncbi:hypothetical protein [Halobacteriaceae bacterium SHR40]|uniref:hypothetical protein n=1 Tax=Halovenus amylolytica TaxID=2500550 RepID=UPI000FE41A20
MVDRQTNDQCDESYQSSFRQTVSSQNQFTLPAPLVRELGFEAHKFAPKRGALVAWYYYEKHDKMVLTTDEGNRPTLDFVGVSSLSGVGNNELASDDVSAAQVTIITDLPDHLHAKLTADSVVLKPIYASEHPTLEETCVAVYPSEDYDEGTLPNVEHEVRERGAEESSSSDETPEVVVVDKHANSV